MNCGKFFLIPLRQVSRSSALLAKPMPVKKTLKLEEDKSFPVETDTQRLANYVCGTNLFIEGGEDVKLKADSEYPEWLWKIEKPVPFEQLTEKSKRYWKEVQRQGWQERKYLRKFFKTATVHK